MLDKIRSGVAFALLVGASFAAQSAGLGKLTVNSALGQVLAAEIELVSLQPGELESLTARVASADSYRDAKIEYSPVLRQLRFSVEKRANGQPYLKVASLAPINEPFMDVLIEVTWPQGRLQREYPILLDPPGFAESKVTAPAAVAARPAPPAQAPAAAVSPAPVSEPPGTPSAKAEMAAPASGLVAEAGKDNYGPVQKGETLNKIAGEVKPASVSLEQMLAALYRENKAAFIDNNMNRLKAGQILRVPSADEVAAISEKEARGEVRSHVANWKSYREGLAGAVTAAPARPDAARAATGKVAAAAVTPPPAPAAEPKDVLKLSKTEPAKGAAAAGKPGSAQDRTNALQEELTARDKALKEAQSRVTDLEKQIRDMQRLVDLKSGAPAKPAEAAKAPEAKVAAAKPAEPPKPAEAPKAAEAAKPAAPAPAETKAAEAAKPAAEAPKPDAAAKPAPPKPAAPKKPAPPPPEPELIDQILDNPIMLAGGVGAVGLLGLGGFLFVRRRRQKAEAGPASSVMASAPSSDMQSSTMTGKPGGGLVDTGNSSFLTDFDKAAPSAIDTDEVDPVAEAEVYIAYGRDAQAEEILKEAMGRDQNRHEIPLKLLEIYHARKSAPAFEAIAKNLYAAVGAASPIWQKAAAMGAQIDPTNALYGGAAEGAEAADFEAAAPVAKPNLDFDLDTAPKGAAGAAAPEAEAPMSFDLDIGGGEAPAAPVAEEASGLDFDIDAVSPSAAAAPAPAAEAPKEEKSSFDFDLSGLDFPSSTKPETPAAAAAAPDMDLGFDQTVSTHGSAGQAPSLNLTDLDLGGGSSPTGGGDAVSTKLELAKAYLEIGDKDGAREILTEVAKEGSAAQKEEAQKLIASL